MANDDARAQRVDRHAAGPQQRLHLATATQMSGQRIGVIPQTAEVDDPVQPRFGGYLGELSAPAREFVLDVATRPAHRRVAHLQR